MIEKININPIELDYLFGNQEENIEISLGSIKNEFWGDNIAMVSAIVGKNGTGKSSILKYIKRIKDINLPVSSFIRSIDITKKINSMNYSPPSPAHSSAWAKANLATKRVLDFV